MILAGKKLSLVITKSWGGSFEAGWRKGDVMFAGTLEGKVLRGKYYYHTNNPKFIRCFGRTRPTSSTASLVEKGRGLKMKYVLLRHLIRSCRITKRNPASLTVRR